MDEHDPRAILARNLCRQIEFDRYESSHAWALARGLDVKLIYRMTKGQNLTLEKLDEVAKVIGVPSWQLLLPEFEPGKVIEPPLTAGDRELLAKLKRLLG